jgi:hypothetical protein
MHVTAVESSVFATVAYDETRELLQLEFRSQEIYQYLGVPVETHVALLAAPSKGGYFNQAIRPCFPYCRVSRLVGAAESEASIGGPR